MNDIWGMLGKKKDSNTLTIPAKKTATATAQPVQATKIKPPKVRPHKKTKVQVKKHTEVTEPQIDDFDVSTS